MDVSFVETSSVLSAGGQEPTSDASDVIVSVKAIDQFREALLNRDHEVQLTHLREVLQFFEEYPEHRELLRDGLVEANVIETLTETVNSLNVPVVCASLSLLDELVVSKMCIAQCRAGIILQSVLRGVLLFAELSNDCNVVQQGLGLISKIVMILVQEEKELKSFCDLSQLVNVSRTVLKLSSENPSVLQTVSQIVYTVLLSSDNLLDDDIENGVGFSSLVAELLDLLCQATSASPDIDIDTAICEVGATCMRLFLGAAVSRIDVLEPLHSIFRTAMAKLIVPHITEWVPLIHDTNIREMLTLLKGVISMYHYPDPTMKLEFSKLLVENNFLTVLPPLEVFCKSMIQYMAIRQLVVEILLCLCSNELGDLEWAPALSEGMKSLPFQGTLSRLEPYDFEDHLCTTIIAYNYFVVKYAENPDITVDLFKDICTYVGLMEAAPPPPVFRALWLCFAVGLSLHEASCYAALRTNSAFILLAETYEVATIFTQHPAILCWTFRFESVLKDFKTDVMGLWIEGSDDAATTSLKSLLAQSRESFTLYMEILARKCMDVEAISPHMSTILEALRYCDEEFVELVSYDAWSLLPEILLKCCLQTDSCGAIPLLVFCSEFQPQLIDQDLLMRIACMAPGTLTRYSTKAPQPSGENPLKLIAIFKFMWALLNKVEEKNENMILAPLLNHERFVIALEESFALRHEELTIVVLELLSTLLLLQRKHTTTSCRRVVVDGAELTKLLYGGGGVATSAVKMFFRLLTAHDVAFSSKLIVDIKEPSVRIMYTRLHMICSVGSDELSAWCWTCLHRLLLHAQDDCLMGRHLASLPFTHDLIRSCSPATAAWDAMFEFLSVWLPCQPPAARERSLGSLSLDETLLRLAQIEVTRQS